MANRILTIDCKNKFSITKYGNFTTDNGYGYVKSANKDSNGKYKQIVFGGPTSSNCTNKVGGAAASLEYTPNNKSLNIINKPIRLVTVTSADSYNYYITLSRLQKLIGSVYSEYPYPDIPISVVFKRKSVVASEVYEIVDNELTIPDINMEYNGVEYIISNIKVSICEQYRNNGGIFTLTSSAYENHTWADKSYSDNESSLLYTAMDSSKYYGWARNIKDYNKAVTPNENTAIYQELLKLTYDITNKSTGEYVWIKHPSNTDQFMKGKNVEGFFAQNISVYLNIKLSKEVNVSLSSFDCYYNASAFTTGTYDNVIDCPIYGGHTWGFDLCVIPEKIRFRTTPSNKTGETISLTDSRITDILGTGITYSYYI